MVTSHASSWLHHGQSNFFGNPPLVFFGGGFRFDALSSGGGKRKERETKKERQREPKTS